MTKTRIDQRLVELGLADSRASYRDSLLNCSAHRDRTRSISTVSLIECGEELGTSQFAPSVHFRLALE